MAFDKNQLLIHQLQVKAQRLEDGLRKFVEYYEKIQLDDFEDVYCYALGCLGGDDLKKKLFKTDKFVSVVNELKEKKFMKTETADKNIELWNEKNANCERTPEISGEADAEGMNEITIIAVPESCESKDQTVMKSESKMFGTVDSDGNIIPVEKKTICEFAQPSPVISKSGIQSSGLQFGGESKSGPIFCY